MQWLAICCIMNKRNTFVHSQGGVHQITFLMIAHAIVFVLNTIITTAMAACVSVSLSTISLLSWF